MSKKKLISILSEIRDLFPVPEQGTELENLWASAMADPESVLPYIEACIKNTNAEPVGWQFFDNGHWQNGDDRIKDHRANTEEAGYPVRDVFAAPIAQVSAVPVTGDDFRTCAIADSNYASGMLLGWNLCVANDEASFVRIRGDRMRAAAQASRANKAQDASKSKHTIIVGPGRVKSFGKITMGENGWLAFEGFSIDGEGSDDPRLAICNAALKEIAKQKDWML